MNAQSPGKNVEASTFSRQSTVSNDIHNMARSFTDEYPMADHFLIEEETEDIVSQTIRDVIDSAMRKVCASEMESKLIPFIVLKAKSDLLEILRVSMLKKDAELHGYLHECWMEDKENPAADADAHSRGLIPVISRPNSADNSVASSPIPSSEGGQINGMKSNKQLEKYFDGRGKQNGTKTLNMNDEGNPVVLHIEDNHTISAILDHRKLLSTADSDVSRRKHVQKLKERAESEKKAAELLRSRMEQMEKEERIMRDKLRRELKGKQYTYDTDGSVIIVNPVNPEKLPESSVHIRVHVKSSDQQGDLYTSKYQKREAQGAKQKSDGGAIGSHNEVIGKTPTKSKRAFPTADESFFKETVAQPITHIDHIKIAPGVVVREGSRMRAAEKTSGDPSRWSKKDYEAAISSNKFPESPTRQTSILESTSYGAASSREVSELIGFKESKIAAKQKEIVNQAKMASVQLASRELADAERLDKIAERTKINA